MSTTVTTRDEREVTLPDRQWLWARARRHRALAAFGYLALGAGVAALIVHAA